MGGQIGRDSFFHEFLNGVEGHGAFEDFTGFHDNFLVFELNFKILLDFLHEEMDSGELGIMKRMPRLGQSNFSLHCDNQTVYIQI